jgi:hypothetical protein
MSWSSLANNQIVSDSNLSDAVATGVFAAKTSIPLTGRELTTTAATDYAYVNVSDGRSSNQLVNKSSLSASSVGPGPYQYYVYGVDGGSMFKSTNGGFTFASYTALPYQGPGVYTLAAANSSGQYLITASDTINNTLYISTDYGATFSTKNIINVGGGYTFGSFYPLNADISSSGQYIVVVGKTQPSTTLGQVTIAVSNDYGSTFIAYYGGYQTSTASRASVAISQNGNLVIYVAASTSSNNSWRYTSTNYGSSFTYGGLSTNQIFSDVCTSSTGQYILIVNKGTNGNSGNLFVSSNSGGSYTSRSTLGNGEYCGMSSNGTWMEVFSPGSNTGSVLNRLYYSSNNGVNWNYLNEYTNLGIIGLAVGDLFQSPLTANYISYYQNSSNKNVIYSASLNPFTTQPLTYNFSINKIYRKAINY